MALRASETFVVATEDGKRVFEKNEIVPAKIAKGRDALVFDDAKVSPVEPLPYTRGPRVIEEPKPKAKKDSTDAPPVGVAAE